VGDLFLKLQAAEQASKDAAAKLMEEVSKGADKLKAQVAGKDAVIAARDTTIADLQKAADKHKKKLEHEVTALNKALSAEWKRAQKAAQEADAKAKTAAKQLADKTAETMTLTDTLTSRDTEIAQLSLSAAQAEGGMASALAEVVGLKKELAALKLEHKKKLEDGTTALLEEVCKGADKHTSIYISTYLYIRTHIHT
jgi:chromosome segregation ATPase